MVQFSVSPQINHNQQGNYPPQLTLRVYQRQYVARMNRGNRHTLVKNFVLGGKKNKKTQQ